LALGLDNDVLGRRRAPTLTRFQHVIGGVAIARQPDAAIDHGNLAGPRADADRLPCQKPQAAVPPGCAKVRKLLRKHHQSPIQWPLSFH
jgi:hypothetical protein